MYQQVNTLLIIDVHARDIVDGFVRESILHAKVNKYTYFT
jgi:dynein heavy chain, axonemal